MNAYPWSRGAPSPLAPSRGLWGFFQRHLQGVTVAVMVTLLIGFIVYPYMLITVPAGEAGVLWKRFTGPGIYCHCILPAGTALDPDEIRHEGLHFIWPWDKLYIYNLRLQSSNQKFNAISQDGVFVTAEITIRYQLNFSSIGVLHLFVGPGYLNTLLIPEIGSVARSVIANYTAEQVYSTERQQIQEKIADLSRAAIVSRLTKLFQSDASIQETPQNFAGLLPKSIQIVDTPVLSIDLPSEIVAAINQKIEQFYKIKEYQFRAQREAEESKRKQIEANGIAAFQRTVTQGISDSYLRWQGIQATLALAQSPNSKIVIIGSGKEGLPIILGNVDTPPPSSPGSKPGDHATPPAQKMAPASPEAAPQATPSAPESKPGAGSPTADKKPSTSLDLSDIKSIISKLSDALRTSGPATTSPPKENPK
jgi:regulator of protease activity HflC (stomatin/prohibitin superfamily)